MHVVFHAEGMRPWRHSFARTATSPDLARHAAIRMQGATGLAAWRIAFLPRQPAVRDVHLHVMVLPVGDLGDTLPFLLDSRRVFGGKLCNIQLLRTRPGRHNDPHGFANAAEQALLHAGLAEVSFAFHVSAHRPAAVVVPAWEGLPACVLEDSVHIILQFPGLRQAILRDAQSASRPHAGTGPSTTATTTTTTTTTTFMLPDEPFRFIPPSPRRTIARLGIPTGTATGTFVEVTLAESVELPALLHRLTQRAAQQQCLPPGHSIAVSPCQPEARASYREILFHLVPPQVDKEHCYVWVDLRPSAELSYLRSATLAEPNSVSIRRLNVRSLYLNAHRWDEPRALRHGDLVSIAIAPQAPDIRPPDQIAQSRPGMQALAVPMPVPSNLNLDPADAEELDINSAFMWDEAISARLRAFGFSNACCLFTVVGPGFAFTASVGRLRPTLMQVTDWLETWLGGNFPSLRVYDAGVQHNGRWVFVATPGFMDPQYVLVTADTPALAAYLLPHGTTSATVACLVPSPQLQRSTPVPGSAYHADFWPPCAFAESEFLLLRENRATAIEDTATSATGRWRRHRYAVSSASASSTHQPENPTAAVPTTTTTTEACTTRTTTVAVAPHGRIAITVMAEGIMVSRYPAGPDIAHMAEAIMECMIEHIHRERAPHNGVLRLAQTMPHHPSAPWNEALIVWSPLDFNVHVVLDLRAIGGGVRQIMTEPDQDPERLIAVYTRQAGAFLWVNGIPRRLYTGCLHDADVITAAWNDGLTFSLPRSVLFRAWPLLALLAVDIHIPAAYDPPREYVFMMPNLRRQISDALESRAVRLGFWLNPRRMAIIYNRERGEIALFVQSRLPAALDQVREALTLIDTWTDADEVTDTREMAFNTSLFIARDNFERRSRFQLIPIPNFPQAHLLWQVDNRNFAEAASLPAPPHLLVQADSAPTHGRALLFRRRSSSGASASASAGTSMAQLSWKRKSAALTQTPCEALSHNAPPARVALCHREFAQMGIGQHDTDDRRHDALAVGPFAGCRAPSAVTNQPAMRMPRLLPPDFALIIDSTYTAVARTMAAPEMAEDTARYTIFDPIHQIRIRLHRADMRLEWLVADILRSTPEQIRSIQLLADTVYGFPEPQLVLTFADSPAEALAVGCARLMPPQG